MDESQLFEIHAFTGFTYSKYNHFKLFKHFRYDIELYGREVDPIKQPIKTYQDLLIFAYLKNNIKPGSRILEIGGGNSRIIRHFCTTYECWNIDKLKECGNGPTEIPILGFRLVKDYIGNFNNELPDNYFDFVFSISALEHVPDNNAVLFDNINRDMSRVLKRGGLSLHCFDIVIKKDNSIWTNKLLPYLFEKTLPINSFIPFKNMLDDPDIFFISKEAYDNFAKRHTKKEYEEFGKLMSYNILWVL